MKVSDLNAPELNFWVAKSAGLQPTIDLRGENTVSVVNSLTGKVEPYQPSFDWSQAGPLLAKEWYDIETTLMDWFGPHWAHMKDFREDALTWFVRAYVAVRFGEEVEDWPVE